MELVSDFNYQQLTSALLPSRNYRPLVGDYICVLNPDYLHTESGLYQDNPTRSRNTVLKLYRVTRVSRNSIYTVSDIVNHTEYLRWQPFEGCWSSVYPRWTQMLAVGTIPRTAVDVLTVRDIHLPIQLFRHRNTVECITCGCQIQLYRTHPHPEDTLVPPQECFNCDTCFMRNSSA